MAMLRFSLSLRFTLALGLPSLAQTTTITNPGGPSLAGFPASALGWVLDFNTMAWGDPSHVTLQVWGIQRFKDPDLGNYTVRTDFLARTDQLPPTAPTNTPIPIGAVEALALGVPQQQLDSFFANDPATGWVSAYLYKAYLSTATPVSFAYTNQGTAVLFVDIPAAGTWQVTVIDSHPQTKGAFLTVPSVGIYGIQVNNVYAGNVRVAISTPTTGAYYRQEPLVVRGGSTAGAGVRFVTDTNAANRYRIKHLSLGQGSQDENGAVPLLAGKDTMVRVMVEDLKGEFVPGFDPVTTNMNVQLDFVTPTGTTIIPLGLYGSPKAIETETAQPGGLTPPAVVPAASVAPGLIVTARILNAQGVIVDTKQVIPQVQMGRTIHLYPFNIYPTTYANTPAELQAKIAPWFEERFPLDHLVIHPYGDISYYGGLLRNGYTFMENVLNTMNYIAAMNQSPYAGYDNIYVGIIDKQYAPQGGGFVGRAAYGFPGIALIADDTFWPQAPADILAHEMAHCFGIHHAPSPGAADPDLAYPYSANGRCAGYGYSKQLNFFNREINQYQDLMAYGWNGLSYFSDYNFRKLLGVVGGAMAIPASAISVSAGPPDLNLPRNASGSYVMGKKAIAAYHAWVANKAPKAGCELPGPIVFGEHGESFHRVPRSEGGHWLLPAFDAMGPSSLTPSWMAPILEPQANTKAAAPTSSNGVPWLVVDPTAD